MKWGNLSRTAVAYNNNNNNNNNNSNNNLYSCPEII